MDQYADLLNALGNCETVEATLLARQLSKSSACLRNVSINIDDLLIAFQFNDPALHDAITDLIVAVIDNVDFRTVYEKYGKALLEHKDSEAGRKLLIQVSRKAVTHGQSNELVQSTLFPFLVILLVPGNANSSVEEVEAILEDIVNKSPENYDLINKTLQILPKDVPSLQLLKLRLSIKAHCVATCKSLIAEMTASNDSLFQMAAFQTIREAAVDLRDLEVLESTGIHNILWSSASQPGILATGALECIISFVKMDAAVIEKCQCEELIRLESADESVQNCILVLSALCWANGRQWAAECVDCLIDMLIHRTGTKQMAALSAMEALFSAPQASSQQQSFCTAFNATHGSHILNFFITSIPGKGDEQERISIYNAISACLANDWLVREAFSTRLFSFLLNRNSDASLAGLHCKYDIITDLVKNKNVLLGESMSHQFKAYLSLGVNFRPVVSRVTMESAEQ